MKRIFLNIITIYFLLSFFGCNHFLTHKFTSFNRNPTSSVDTSQKIKDAHNNYKNNWENTHKPKEINRFLNKIIKNQEDIIEEEFIYLKSLRKHANLYRISFVLFSKESKIPKAFNQYVKVFGKLNDSIEFGNDELAIKYAKNMKTWIKNNKKQSVSKEFKPKEYSNFKNNIQDILTEIQEQFHQTEFNQKNYHELRKELKLILQIYFYESSINGELSSLGFWLDNLVNEIGLTHDRYIKKVLTETNRPEDERIVLSATERDLILAKLEIINQNIFGKNCPSLLKELFK